MRYLKNIFIVLMMMVLLSNYTIYDNNIETEEYKNKEKKSFNDIEYDFFSSHFEKNIIDLIYKYSFENDLEPALIISLIYYESSFNPDAININKNGSIDRGLCQLNNNSFPDISINDFFDIENNIKIGCNYLRWCIDNSGIGTIQTGLICYNGGIGNFKRDNIKESTLKYVDKIINLKNQYDYQVNKIYNENNYNDWRLIC